MANDGSDIASIMATPASKVGRHLASSTRIIIPTYGTQDALNAIFRALPAYFHNSCIVIDDCSPKPITVPNGVTLTRHPINRGYGGSQQTGYGMAISQGAEQVLMIHGDNQYSVEHSLALLPLLRYGDIALGSRLLWNKKLEYPAWRLWGNRFLTHLTNKRFNTKHRDLHTGARAYRGSFLRGVPFKEFSNNYIFDQQLLVWALKERKRIIENPMPPKYDTDVLRIPPLKALQYGLGCVLLNFR